MENKNGTKSWYEFTQDSSMHGIKYVKTESISIVRRILWSLFILAFVGYFIFATYQFMSEYARFPVITKVKVKKASNLKFPTVTICNRNYWMKSFSVNNDTPVEISDLFTEMLSDMYLLSAESPPPDGKYNWSEPTAAALVNMSRSNLDQMLQSMAHPLNSTFVFCMVRRELVPCHTLFEQVKTDSGYCYRFNGDGSFEANAAGLNGGVQFVLDTLTSEYYIGPYSYSEGFSVALHDADVVPLVSELNYGIGPGTEVNMVVQKTETKRVPPPADDGQADCFDTTTKTNPLHYFKNYTYSGCYQECKVSFVMNSCGCRDLLQPALNDSESCDIPQMLYCSTPAQREFHSSDEHLSACDCRSVCTDVEYSAKLSVLRFPSRGYVESLQALPADFEYMRENYVSLSIFYGQMSFVFLEEKKAYTPPDLIASLGGTLGVCIGGSMLTLVEFIEFGILAFAKILQSKKAEKSPVRTFRNSVSYADEKKPNNWLDAAKHT